MTNTLPWKPGVRSGVIQHSGCFWYICDSLIYHIKEQFTTDRKQLAVLVVEIVARGQANSEVPERQMAVKANVITFL